MSETENELVIKRKGRDRRRHHHRRKTKKRKGKERLLIFTFTFVLSDAHLSLAPHILLLRHCRCHVRRVMFGTCKFRPDYILLISLSPTLLKGMRQMQQTHRETCIRCRRKEIGPLPFLMMPGRLSPILLLAGCSLWSIPCSSPGVGIRVGESDENDELLLIGESV
jgi:hypothetical protein